MDIRDKIIEQIKKISLSVTENTYNTKLKEGYELLLKLHDLGVDKENVYQSLLEYLGS